MLWNDLLCLLYVYKKWLFSLLIWLLMFLNVMVLYLCLGFEGIKIKIN